MFPQIHIHFSIVQTIMDSTYNIHKYSFQLYYLGLCCIYVISFIIGYHHGNSDFELYQISDSNINKPEILEISSSKYFLNIVKNNITVSLIFFISGILTVGILPCILAFYNGFVFGDMTGYTTNILPLNSIIGSTVPHSFEFLGLNLFGAIGFYISLSYVTQKRLIEFKKILFLLTIATAIIICAAFSESYISINTK